MRIAIFGTGRMFYNHWKYIDREQVVCLMDNSEDKIGKQIEGIEVISPKCLKASDCDMVLILSVYYDEMKRQLIENGIPEHMIYNYLYIGNMTRQPAWIYHTDGKQSFEDWCNTHQNKRALLISHQLSYTGAPIALMNMARVMRRMGISVLYAGLEDGPLKKELEINHIDYVPNWKLLDRETQKEFISGCGLVVISTACLKGLAEEYKDAGTPVIWWIHESEPGYVGIEQIDCGENVSVFCGGEYARRVFWNHCKDRDAQILQYSIPEEELFIAENERPNDDKISFGLIGTISERKAQDIFLRAVLKLPTDIRDKIEVIIIGAVAEMAYWEEQKPLLQQMKNIRIIGEIPQRELSEKYKEIDVLVCPSRDDPMPIVVTQAMMYGIPCILSKNVGQVEFIESGVNGFVFEHEEEFAEQMAWVVNHRERLYNIGRQAREIYKQNFSETIMEKRLEELWQKNANRGNGHAGCSNWE